MEKPVGNTSELQTVSDQLLMSTIQKSTIEKPIKSDRKDPVIIDEAKLFKSINVKMYLEGNTREEAIVSLDPAGKPPSWFDSQFYFIATLLCMGWAIRLYLYVNTVCVNYYLKKVLIK